MDIGQLDAGLLPPQGKVLNTDVSRCSEQGDHVGEGMTRGIASLGNPGFVLCSASDSLCVAFGTPLPLPRFPFPYLLYDRVKDT